jgi:light-harvesting complex II chlorophyll a/b binding protein 5
MAALAGGCTAAVLGQAEFLGRALSGGASVSSSNGGGAVMMPGLLQVVSVLGTKKKLAAGPVKKAVQKAVAKVNRPTNEELAKWYGPDRRIYLPEGLLSKSDIPAYLTGEVPGE